MADQEKKSSKSGSRPAPSRKNSDESEDQGYESRSRSASRRRRRQNQRQRGQGQGKAQAGKSKAQSMASVQEQEEPEDEEQAEEVERSDQSKWLKNPEPQETTETQPFDYIKPPSEGMMGPVTYAKMMRGEIPWRGPPPTQPYDTTQGVNAKTEGPDPMEQDGLKLRIELNLDIEIELKAHIHGDLTLALLAIQHESFPTSTDTIYALSTASGRAAIAVIRISGPACLTIYHNLCPNTPSPKPRTAVLRKLRSPNDNTRILDTGALLLYFPAPKTVTGEDVLELHVHGGPAIVRSVLEAIPQAARARDGTIIAKPAEAGEFTKRAFYNGRIDLAEVEALGEALVAETEQQRRLAVSGAASALTQRYEEWRSMLLYARGELEALIDFSEDQHFDESPAEFISSVSKQVVELKKQLELHILNANRGELLRSGINVALLGAPNAGKSSLLNRIVGREAAIVSTEEGTTRDIVDVTIDIQGWLVRLGDMAGVRNGLSPFSEKSQNQTNVKDSGPTVGSIELEGIRRARERALQSDLVIVLVSLQPGIQGSLELVINNELLDAVHECRTAGKEMLFALNKIDLLHQQTGQTKTSLSRLLSQLITTFPSTSPHDVFCLSCWEADVPNLDQPDAGGLQTFLSGLASKFQSMTSAAALRAREQHGDGDVGNPAISPAEAQSYWTASLGVTHRQSMYLRECLTHLEAFLEGASPPDAYIETGVQAPAAVTTPDIPSPQSSTPNHGYFATEDIPNPIDPGLPEQPSNYTYHTDNHADLVAEIETVISNPTMTTTATDHESPPSNSNTEVDIVTSAEHLRHAADCLSKLTGRGDGVSSGADVEDVLGVVFEK